MLVAALAGLFAFTSAAIAKPQPGELDRSFSGNGVVRTAIPPRDSFPQAVAIGRKGRIVVAGFNNNGFALARYKQDGHIDRSLSGDGRITTSFPNAPGARTSGHDVAIGHKGSIVVGGQACPSPLNQCDFAVARYTSDGHLDQSFGDGGRVTVSFPGNKYSVARGVAITPGGGVLLGGTTCPHSAFDDCKFALAKLDASGRLDPTFGSHGRVITQLTNESGDPIDGAASDMAIDSRGRITLAGTANPGLLLARYKPNGDPDGSFGRNGTVAKGLCQLRDSPDITVDANDKIVVACKEYTLARFDGDGRLDRSFGKGGVVRTNVVPGRAQNVFGVAIDSRGRIAVTGEPHFTVVRYQPNGKVNKAFGRNGRATAKFGSGWSLALAIDSRDRPVVAGFVEPRSSHDRIFAVARFLG
jgi:uncharacterized delta-60 repeat protein